MRVKVILAILTVAMLSAVVVSAKGINNCEDQVARFKKICEEDPNATNMDACFNYKVFSRWCFDKNLTQQNQPVVACEARSAVIREEAEAAPDAKQKEMRLKQAEQNDKVCGMMRKAMGLN